MNTILLLIGLGGGATLLTQVLKRVAKLEKSWIIRTLFHTTVVAGTVVSFALGTHGIGAITLTAGLLHGGALEGFGNTIYPVVKWLDKWLTKVSRALKVVNKDEALVESTIAAATVATQNTNTEDF